MFYGLPPIECRRLAYQMATINRIKYPNSWDCLEMAGIDWFKSFMKRHPELSLRTPEGCSLSRATSFNQHNVKIFFDNLQLILTKEPEFSDGTRTFSLDETGTTTVHKPLAIVAGKGIKQVAKSTSAEKSTLVTTCCIVSCSGHS